ncbi:hypothetical protein BGZ95_004918 [Linnemannia exigua]|uniref:Uncharacterized protein n=1 Tax=Linnemannia exigua TaxID=604196 RepID=A0AAD4DH19_9FUNG|nr:hypothetical protein BGZ95_004918 [Linnemannia exigua]
MLHYQVLQIQSRQIAQHGLQHHSQQVGIPQIINQQMTAQTQATAQVSWLIQSLAFLENQERASLQSDTQRRTHQSQNVNIQQTQERLETLQVALLQAQRLFDQQYPLSDLTVSRQTLLSTHGQALFLAERQATDFNTILESQTPLFPQEHQRIQLRVIQFLQTLETIQFHQMRLVHMEPPQPQQRQEPDVYQNPLTLLSVMERLQSSIETCSRIQAFLDSAASTTAIPWFIDTAKDEQWLVRFISRFSGLRAFGSANLILSNKEVFELIGHLWSDLRVLSLVLFKHALSQSSSHYLDLDTLLDRCPPHLESLQLSFSHQRFYYHPTSHEFTRINENTSAVGSGSVPLSKIPTLRRAFIEGEIGSTSPVQDDLPWVKFLCRCPNMQSLALASCSPNVILLIASKVKDYWPLLQEFAIFNGLNHHVTFDNQLDQNLAILLNATCQSSDLAQDDQDANIPLAAIDLSPTKSGHRFREGMKKVRFDRIIFKCQSAAIQSLFRMSNTLTHLSMRDCEFTDGFPSETLLRLLRACDRLEEVDLLPSGSHFRATMMPINAHHLVKFFSPTTPWPSAQTLRVLRVMIEGFVQVPISTTTADAGSVSSSSVAYSMTPPPATPMVATSLSLPPGPINPVFLNGGSFSSSIPSSSSSTSSTSVPMQSPLEVLYVLQREVCQVLGSFTALEELSLGVHLEMDQTGYQLPNLFQQPHCLDLILESGLNLMSGLKRLRVLNVSRMNHRIGVQELVWMKEHWPRLHTVEGLLRVANLDRYHGLGIVYEGQRSQIVPPSVLVTEEEEELREEARESENELVQWVGKNFSRLAFS